MTLLFMDSWDHYDDADLPNKWTVVGGTPEVNAGIGRNGTSGLLIAGSETIAKTYPGGNLTDVVVGVAFKAVGTLLGGAYTIIALLDSTTVQVDIRIDAGTGQLQLTRNGTLLATSVDSINADVFYYIEFKANIANAGSAEVRVNEVAWITFSGDTQSTANAFTTGMRLGRGAGGINASYYDDLYIISNAGPPNNDYLGDIRVEAVLPDGAGNSTEWTPSAGANWQNVDDNPPDSDTSYNSSATASQQDTFSMADLVSTSGTIKGIQTLIYARKDDAGARTIRRVTRSGATDYYGSNESISAETYTYFIDIQETDPNTGAAWTIPNFNSSEAGVDLVA